MVITGLTRNQFAGNGTWVRIPPSPPEKKHLLSTGQKVFLLAKIFLVDGINPTIAGCNHFVIKSDFVAGKTDLISSAKRSDFTAVCAISLKNNKVYGIISLINLNLTKEVVL